MTGMHQIEGDDYIRCGSRWMELIFPNVYTKDKKTSDVNHEKFQMKRKDSEKI